MQDLESRLSAFLDRRKANKSLRAPVAKQNLIDFCSNDYLGLARSITLKESIAKAYADFGQLGATGSRLLTGHHPLMDQLEQQIAQFHNAQTALLFNSGYDANLGLISCITRPSDIILYDKLVHASIHDGMRLSSATALSFAHNDLEELTTLLQTHQEIKGALFVVVESVYSMDGDYAPLSEITSLCQEYNAHLIVDEAHATGIVGPKGGGLVQEFGLEESVFARLHTFGKALGCHGAVVLGGSTLRNYLLNFARSLIYTTALPIHSLISIQEVYNLLDKNGNKIKQELTGKVKFFTEKVKNSTIELLPSTSSIQSVLVPGNEKVVEAAATLEKEGFDVRPIRYPTVARGEERLRVCIHRHNSVQEIEKLIASLNKI
ncbi:MAG: pyridoxal phosphate-dependent aminotransferase family protein [Aureispira sp.]|nr:pyridoxal phosphate-dependent aminotransferase family protein [Aureispira sp.]